MAHTKSLLQWNCNGYYKHLAELRQLLAQYDSSVICLQETNFKFGDQAKIRGYSCHRIDRLIANQASGGVATFVREDVFCQEVNLNTQLEAVAVQIPLPGMTTICNVYLPPGALIDSADIEDLIAQLPPPFILLGDFNAHHPLWGDPNSDARGHDL